MLTLNCSHKTTRHIIQFPFKFVILSRLKHALTSRQLYQTLGVTEDCDDEALRLAFVHLAKRFHPDSGMPEADANRFSEIEAAYREIRRRRIEEQERDANSKAEEYDIKHTAPQHRHYLVHDVGIGTTSKRQRLHSIQRAQKAMENVMEHRLQKIQAKERNTLVGIDKQRAKDIKTRYGMDRLVEDLIQEAMQKGEFNSLPGMGKPLKDRTSAQNPYVDFVTHKLNEIMINNGFTPEWIQLSKEIREETQEVRKQLTEARNRLGSTPFTIADDASWTKAKDKSRSSIKRINAKIDKYNLLVPILQKQMLHIELDALAEEVLAIAPKKSEKKQSDTYTSKNYTETDYLGELFNIFSNKKAT